MSEFELHSLPKIFAYGQRSFQIPDYQRGYSWETPQVQDLIKDLEHSSSLGMRHFGGTLVAVEANSGQKDVFDIVDGQQRLTTLIILLRTLHAKKGLSVLTTEDKGDINIYNTFIFDETVSGRTRRMFKLNRETDNFFLENILKDNPAPVPGRNKSHANLLNTKALCEDWLKDKDATQSQQILHSLMHNFGFLFYAPKNTSETGLMFEVINNRGKRLSQLDKVKNYLLYYAAKGGFTDLSEKVNIEWGNNLLYLNDAGVTSNADENSFLRNCYLVFFRPVKSDSHAVYDRLKEQFPAEATTEDKAKKIKTLIRFVDFLGKATLAYRKLITQQDVASDEEKIALLRLCLQPTIASVTPLVLAVFTREQDDKKRAELFALIEKLNFRYYGCDIAPRADSGQGQLFAYAHDFYRFYGKQKDEEAVDSLWLIQRLTNFVRKNAPDRRFVESLVLAKDESDDFYYWKSLKFFLANYEHFLQQKGRKRVDLRQMLVGKDEVDQNMAYEREHIWARAETSYINDEDEDEYHINKRRLGNFVLLEPSINRSVGAKPIAEKVASYFSVDRKDIPSTKMLRELQEMYEESEGQAVSKRTSKRTGKTWRKSVKYWDEVFSGFMDRREEKMVNFALKRWQVASKRAIKKVEVDSLRRGNQVFQEV